MCAVPFAADGRLEFPLRFAGLSLPGRVTGAA
jgi:hypothetical protein